MSNLYGIFAVLAWPLASPGQFLTFFAVFFSIIYHVIEVRKHGMPGIKPFANGSQHQHEICINLDRIAAGSLGCYLTFLIWNSSQWSLFFLGAIAISFNLLSELFRWHEPLKEFFSLSAEEVTWWYVIWHSLWHIAAFHVTWMIALTH